MSKGGIPKWAHKRDDNEKEIRQALEAIGWQVILLSQTGMPDAIANHDGVTIFLEIKSKRGQLTPAQSDLILAWQGAPLRVVHSVDEAIQAVGAGYVSA